jgi:RNase P protein component
MVFIARPPIARATYAEIAHAIEELLSRANLLQSLNKG